MESSGKQQPIDDRLREELLRMYSRSKRPDGYSLQRAHDVALRGGGAVTLMPGWNVKAKKTEGTFAVRASFVDTTVYYIICLADMTIKEVIPPKIR